MASLADYFEKHRYKPKWFCGDRVQGKFNKIPFIGSVLNDTLYSEKEGPIVFISVDLPLSYKGKIYRTIKMKPNSLKERKKW